MKKRAFKILLLAFVPIFFSGCLGTAAAVASIASSAYTLKEMFDNKEEIRELQVQNKLDNIEKKISKIEKEKLNVLNENLFVTQDMHTPSIQNYYAYPVY